MESNKLAFYSFSKPIWDNVSNECKELIFRLLESDPSRRISFKEILEDKVILNKKNILLVVKEPIGDLLTEVEPISSYHS
jgi:hypothetical protein